MFDTLELEHNLEIGNEYHNDPNSISFWNSVANDGESGSIGRQLNPELLDIKSKKSKVGDYNNPSSPSIFHGKLRNRISVHHNTG